MKHPLNYHFPFTLPSRALVCLGVMAISANAPAQQDSTHQEALREVSIMRNIFAAALEEDDRRNRVRFGQPESLYLAGQGMVFTFNLPGELDTILFNGLDPVAAIGFTRSGRDDFDRTFSFDFNENDRSPRFAGLFNDESASPLQQQLRNMLETMRDRQDEMRRLQRELRDVQRGEDGADSGASEENVNNGAEISRLEDSIEALNSGLRADSENYRQVMTDYQAERNAEQSARRQAQTDMIFTTLCEYGKTLDSLQQDEHVNLVLRNFNDDVTQVFVVDFAAVTSCSSAQTLREGAVSYSL